MILVTFAATPSLPFPPAVDLAVQLTVPPEPIFSFQSSLSLANLFANSSLASPVAVGSIVTVRIINPQYGNYQFISLNDIIGNFLISKK